MPRQIFFYDPPDRFVAGTVGQPGERTFFLQASALGRVTSVALEKTQVAVLAERLEQLGASILGVVFNKHWRRTPSFIERLT